MTKLERGGEGGGVEAFAQYLNRSLRPVGTMPIYLRSQYSLNLSLDRNASISHTVA